MSYRTMSYRIMSYRKLTLLFFILVAATLVLAADKKLPPPPPERAHAPSPAVTDDFIHKQFGDNCSLLAGPPQFVGDLDGDGIDDLVVAAKCKNPMADRDEYSFTVADPYDAFLGFGDIKLTSTFASDAPERRGVGLLIIHGADQHGSDQHGSDQLGAGQHDALQQGADQRGAEKDAWRAEKPKAKFLLINTPFKTLTVKRLTVKKRIVLAIFMEETGEGENMSSVIFWDGKKYKYQPLGSTME